MTTDWINIQWSPWKRDLSIQNTRDPRCHNTRFPASLFSFISYFLSLSCGKRNKFKQAVVLFFAGIYFTVDFFLGFLSIGNVCCELVLLAQWLVAQVSGFNGLVVHYHNVCPSVVLEFSQYILDP